jgi:hypothetical protein
MLKIAWNDIEAVLTNLADPADRIYWQRECRAELARDSEDFSDWLQHAMLRAALSKGGSKHAEAFKEEIQRIREGLSLAFGPVYHRLGKRLPQLQREDAEVLDSSFDKEEIEKDIEESMRWMGGNWGAMFFRILDLYDIHPDSRKVILIAAKCLLDETGKIIDKTEFPYEEIFPDLVAGNVAFTPKDYGYWLTHPARKSNWNLSGELASVINIKTRASRF